VTGKGNAGKQKGVYIKGVEKKKGGVEKMWGDGTKISKNLKI